MAPAAVLPPSLPSPNLSKLDTKSNVATTVTEATSPSPGDLDASLLTITHPSTLKTVPLPDSPAIWASNITTDHMLSCSWSQQSGWAAPSIHPYSPIALDPTASVLHYATECFEGMKVYRGFDNKIRLFRPSLNAQRLFNSATRIALPSFSPDEFLKLLRKFVGLEAKRWLPRPGTFLYLRPTMIATTAAIGVQRPRDALLYVIAVMMPPLDEPQLLPNGEKKLGMRLYASQADMIRAWPGGFGYAKVGANYGPTLRAQGEARAKGYDQILWLFGEEGYVTEAGGSNFFVLWKNAQGKKELVTAPLEEGTILPGITRKSVLELVKERCKDVEVVERQFTMDEVVRASLEGRLIEAFGSGTAFFIAPTSDIHYRGVDVVLPLGQGGDAKMAMTIKGWLKDIMYGRQEHQWADVVDESIQ